MNTRLPTPYGFAERGNLSSGKIKQKGFADRAVIFAVSANPEPEELNPHELLGAKIGAQERQNGEEGLFEILGGYFFQRDASGAISTLDVFGIAADPSQGFQISEGGATLLVDHWRYDKLIGGTREIDERISYIENGWTFIVSPEGKSPGDFPESDQLLEIYAFCPELIRLELMPDPTTAQTLPLSAKLTHSGPTPASYRWDWGDGSPIEENQHDTAIHVYERPIGLPRLDYELRVTALGPGECENSLSERVVVPGCPVIVAQITQTLGASEMECLLSLDIEGPEPDQIWIDWGEGNGKQAAGDFPARHSYPRMEGKTEQSYEITVLTEGPHHCQATATVQVSVPGCPLLRIQKAERALAGGLEIVLSGQIEGPTPDKLTIDWGEGKDPQAFEQFPLTHIYPLPVGQESASYAIIATAEGPGGCRTQASEQVNIQGCPALDIEWEVQTEASEVEVVVKGSVLGVKPDRLSINWGTGAGIQVFEDFPLSHRFARPQGLDFRDHVIRVMAEGPGTCSATETHEIRLPGCPVLTLSQQDTLSHSGMQVQLDVQVQGPRPELFTIDWGDNKPATLTTTFPVSRNYPRPLRQAFQEYAIKVQAVGPEGCATSLSLQAQVPGCPVLAAKARQETRPGEVVLTLEGSLDGPAPDRTLIDWGEGKGAEPVSGFPLKHTYTRPQGEAGRDYAIQFSTQGPFDCQTLFKHSLRVPGCPRISFDLATELSATGMKVSLQARTTGPEPDLYTIDWGDGKQATPLKGFPASRNFPRPIGEISREYNITLTASGPEGCNTNHREVVQVPGCPRLTLRPVSTVSPTGMQVALQLDIAGPKPDLFLVSWGDELGESPVGAFPVSRNFARPVGENFKEQEIVVKAIGPDECRTEVRTSVHIPGCPHITLESETEIRDTDMLVRLNGKIEGPQPEQLSVTWGDGAGTKVFDRFPIQFSYPRTRGKLHVDYEIRVSATGPERCISAAHHRIQVPGCPVLTPEISHELSPTHLNANVEVAVAGPVPARYTIDWGEGKGPKKLPAFPATHAYERPAGQAFVDCEVHIEALGEQLCPTRHSQTLRIPGRPLLAMRTQTTLMPATARVELNASITGPRPDTYAVDWGDGAGFQPLGSFPARHDYARSPGVEQVDYTLRLQAMGPDVCLTEVVAHIEVPGCPSLDLKLRSWLSSTGLRVSVQPEVKGPTPEHYLIDWGAGAGLVKMDPASTQHVYSRPVGEDARFYEIRVVAQGPDVCSTQAEASIEVPGCPSLQLDLRQEVKAETQRLFLDLRVEGPRPESYTVDWGDGTLAEAVETFPATHNYARTPGMIYREYAIRLSAKGPDKCHSEAQAKTLVPGFPIVEWDRKIEVLPGELRLLATPKFLGPKPERYAIDWGDGQGQQQVWEFPASRTYPRPQGEDGRHYEVVFFASGPDVFQLKETVPLEVPGCPLLQHELRTDLTATHLRATVNGSILGPQPDQIWVDWGDHAEAQVVKAFPVHHDYPRPEGLAHRNYEIRIFAEGPQGCFTQKKEEIRVVGCPLIEISLAEVLSATGMQVTVNGKATGPLPELYVLNWGDDKGSTPFTQFPVSRNYPRPLGEDARDYEITLTATGPDLCSTQKKATIRVPGCPRLALDATLETSHVATKVLLDLAVEGPAPTFYAINWGDNKGSSTTNKFPVSRNFPRPVGKLFDEYEIQVSASGAMQCHSTTSARVRIPGCPRLTPKVTETLSATGMQVVVDALIEGPAPELFTLDWGDDKGATLVGALPVSRNFPRPAGQMHQDYLIRIRGTGPEACISEATVTVRVPGCPRLQLATRNQVTPEEMKVRLEATVTGPAPDRFEVDWGMGAGFEETSGFPAEYVYPRPQGLELLEYEIKVRAHGPEKCLTEARSPVKVPGFPRLELAAKNKLTASSMRVSLSLKREGPAPDLIAINWGDGTPPESGDEFPLVHTYPRPLGEDLRMYAIGVKATGPLGSLVQLQAPVEVPGCPEIELLVSSQKKPEGLEVSLDCMVGGPAPDSYAVNWGKGKKAFPVEQFPVSTLYPYPTGETHKDYLIQVQAKGPDVCKTTAEARLQVPGCPTLDIRTSQEMHPDKMVLTLYGETKGPDPEGFSVMWGDNPHPVEAARLPLTHHYARPQGREKDTYVLRVAVLGHTHCTTEKTQEITVPGCPTLQIRTEREIRPNEVALTLHGEIKGPQPDHIRIDWGLGAGFQEVDSLPQVFSYERPAGVEQIEREIVVEISGENLCSSRESTRVSIPGCPVLYILPLELKTFAEEVQVSLSVKHNGPRPTSILVDWGEGDETPEQVSTFPVIHNYPRKRGVEGETRHIQVHATTETLCQAGESVEVWIPGCPLLHIHTEEKIKPGALFVTLHGAIEGAPSGRLSIDWGDGTHVDAKDFPLIHPYSRRPGVAEDLYNIVTTLKTENACTTTAETGVVVPGCPLPGEIRVEELSITPAEQEMRFSLPAYQGPTPVSFKWNWGDGSEEETFSAGETFLHRYQRPAQDRVLEVSVTVAEACGCSADAHTHIRLQGTCPRIIGLVAGYGILNETKQEVTCFAEVESPVHPPEKYIWHWGDGSNDTETSVPWASHAYDRPKKHSRNYRVQVRGQGPLCGEYLCEAKAATEVEISGRCPVVVDLHIVYAQADPYEQAVQVIAVHRGHKPLSYHWEWGDDTAEETTAGPVGAHAYMRTREKQVFKGRVSIRIAKQACCGECVNVELFEVEIPPLPVLVLEA